MLRIPKTPLLVIQVTFTPRFWSLQSPSLRGLITKTRGPVYYFGTSDIWVFSATEFGGGGRWSWSQVWLNGGTLCVDSTLDPKDFHPLGSNSWKTSSAKGWVFQMVNKNPRSITTVKTHPTDNKSKINKIHGTNYLGPSWPLFLKVNPSKQGPFQAKQGSFGF